MIVQILGSGAGGGVPQWNCHCVNCAAARQDIIDGWDKIIEQDVPFVRNVHEMYQVRDDLLIDTRFSPHWEGAVLHFQRMVVDTLTKQLPSVEAEI